MKTGIVLQRQGFKAIILLNGGEFLQVRAKKEWKEGDLVSIPPKRISWNRYASAAAGIIVLLGMGVFGQQFYLRESMFISIDVNPSIELSVNRFDRIVGVQARNEDGEKVLAAVSVKNMEYAAGVSVILESTEMKNYLTDNSNVIFAVQSGDENKQSEIVNTLSEVSDSAILSKHHNAEIEYMSVSRDIVENAHAHGTTPGKYIYLQQLVEENPLTDIDECKHHSISQLKQEIQDASQGCDRMQNNEEGTNGHHGSGHH